MADLAREELEEHLREQLDFIDSSCDGFDAGRAAESKRLATHIRLLLHDTGQSTSLLTLLGIKGRLDFLDGVPREQREAIAGPSPERTGGFNGGLVVTRVGGDSVAYLPRFAVGAPPFDAMPFAPWWTEPRILDAAGTGFSRRQLVLWMANKDGGAHIDKLPPTYRALTRDGSLGFQGVSPVPAALRQVAEELRLTLRSAS